MTIHPSYFAPPLPPPLPVDPGVQGQKRRDAATKDSISFPTFAETYFKTDYQDCDFIERKRKRKKKLLKKKRLDGVKFKEFYELFKR